MSSLTKHELDDILLYCDKTGCFFYKENRGKFKAGSLAGAVSHNGYFRIKLNGKSYFTHRLVVLHKTGVLPDNDMHVDHIDRNPSNNRWDNLRVTTRLQNMKNKGVYKTSKTGYRGVRQIGNKFEARMKHDGKRYYLGRHDTAEDASIAYETMAKQLHGEYYVNIYGECND